MRGLEFGSTSGRVLEFGSAYVQECERSVGQRERERGCMYEETEGSRAREIESEKVARKMDPSAAKVIGCIVVSWWVDTSPLQSNCIALVRPPKITPARTHVSKC